MHRQATVTNIADARVSRQLRTRAARQPMPDDRVGAVAARTPLGDVFLVEHTMSTRMVGRAADLVASCFGRGEKAIVLFLDEIEAGVRHVLEP